MPIGRANKSKKILQGIHFADLVIARQGVYHVIAQEVAYDELPNFPLPPPETQVAMEIVPFKKAQVKSPMPTKKRITAKYDLQSNKVKLSCIQENKEDR